jgi:hypothetical protein
VGNDDFSTVGGGNAGWELEVTDVQGCTFFKVGDVGAKLFHEGIGKAADFEDVYELVKLTTCLDANGFTGEVKWHVGNDLGLFVHSEEVGVKSGTIERIVLDGLKESEAVAFTFDVEVNEDVFGRAAVEKLLEGACVDLEILVLSTATIDHGGNPALAAHLLEVARTGTITGLCFEDVLGCHDVKAVRLRIPPRPSRTRRGGLHSGRIRFCQKNVLRQPNRVSFFRKSGFGGACRDQGGIAG